MWLSEDEVDNKVGQIGKLLILQNSVHNILTNYLCL